MAKPNEGRTTECDLENHFLTYENNGPAFKGWKICDALIDGKAAIEAKNHL